MGQTIVGQILSRHLGKEVSAGDLALVNAGSAITTDSSAPVDLQSGTVKDMTDNKNYQLAKMPQVTIDILNEVRRL